jgi:hypothetical protein
MPRSTNEAAEDELASRMKAALAPVFFAATSLASQEAALLLVVFNPCIVRSSSERAVLDNSSADI